MSVEATRCRRKFLRFFPKGFADPSYEDWERRYKWHAHEEWDRQLGQTMLADLLEEGKYTQIAHSAVQIESRTNLLFSFEKMALRDAVKSKSGSESFSHGLYNFLYGPGDGPTRLGAWIDVIGRLPRKQTRVLTWPVVTVFGFIAKPQEHIFLKPNVTREAAAEYGFPLHYNSKPNWDTYDSMIGFAEAAKKDMSDLKPRDMIDMQSFFWVLGSEEYAD